MRSPNLIHSLLGLGVVTLGIDGLQIPLKKRATSSSVPFSFDDGRYTAVVYVAGNPMTVRTALYPCMSSLRRVIGSAGRTGHGAV